MESVVRKASRLLQIIFILFLIILFRVWHLAVIQREEKQIESQKPGQWQILLKANRGTLVDRFGIPLAVNRICYNATFYYNQLAQIPVVSWQQEGGKRVKVYTRRAYIRQLSEKLSGILRLEAERVEDLIHSKASLFPHVPFLLKGGLSEEEYYQLKALERDWLGIFAEIGSERFYPLGKTACHVIGTLGAINQREYLRVADEIKQLQEMIEDLELAYPESAAIEEARLRIAELKEKSYTLNDLVGKSGVEAQFEEALRGSFGKVCYEVDQKGTCLRMLPGKKDPVPGKQMQLTLSVELQQFAEQLLETSEKQRLKKPPKQPWVRGSAIVAIEPLTGEILAMASYPNFDPNDFVPSSHPEERPKKQKKIHHWLETEKWLGSIWEGRETLSGGTFHHTPLTWNLFLELLIPPEGPLASFFHKVCDIQTAIQAQEDFETLRYFARSQDPFEEECPQTAHAKKRLQLLFAEIPNLQDRLYALNLCKLVAEAPRFSDALLHKIGKLPLSSYFSLSQTFHRFEERKKQEWKEKFHKHDFQAWKENHQKEFLAQKRKEEKKNHTYARPYLDYLDQKERELFEEFWNQERLSLLTKAISEEPLLAGAAPADLIEPLLHSFRSYLQLTRKERILASSFYPPGGLGFSRSYAFQTCAPLGSMFKLICGYEGLKQGIHLSLIDEQKQTEKGLVVASSMNGTPYHRLYKGGRLPKTSIAHIGPIDIIGALESSSNPFFSILAGDYLKTPEDLLFAARRFGFGQKTEVALPGEALGLLPEDLKTNKTGLYAFAIGQHTLLATPLQSALFLSALANKGSLLKPKILWQDPVEIRSFDPIPPSIRNPLFEGMDRCLWSPKGSARATVIKSLLSQRILLSDYLSMQHQWIGKTSTAEVLWNPFRHPSSKAFMHKHVWFGSIAFSVDPLLTQKARWDHPELVVVVMQRYGDSGKELAPLAAQMIRKWREIKKKNTQLSL